MIKKLFLLLHPQSWANYKELRDRISIDANGLFKHIYPNGFSAYKHWNSLNIFKKIELANNSAAFNSIFMYEAFHKYHIETMEPYLSGIYGESSIRKFFSSIFGKLSISLYFKEKEDQMKELQKSYNVYSDRKN